MPWTLSAPIEQTPPIRRAAAEAPAPLADAGTVRVLSLNIAHGRARGLHQSLIDRQRLLGNLATIGALIADQDADLVALQEADTAAWWSGGIDQVERIARAAGLPTWVQGDQVRSLGLRYGTALLARGRLHDARAWTFPAGPLAPGKGFTVARWQAGAERTASVVSVHLHFASGARQRRQAELLAQRLRELPRPLIVCGDLNAGYRPRGGVVRDLMRTLDLATWRPDDAELATFPAGERRLDWIMVSEPLQISDLRTLPDPVSDHRALVAEVVWPAQPAPAPPTAVDP